MRLKEEYREETVIERSRFIAVAAPCKTEEDARAFIERIRKEFPDSTHVCTAYAIGEGNRIRRSNDNKEPSGTAGMPMLNSILSSGLENTCVCAVRYFGGIKLGTGGLVRAYGGIVKSALEHAPKVRDVPVDVYEVHYPYDLSGTIETWLRRNCTITDILYGEDAACMFETTDRDIEKRIRDLSRGRCVPVFIKHSSREEEV